jgi:hypothetical protein
MLDGNSVQTDPNQTNQLPPAEDGVTDNQEGKPQLSPEVLAEKYKHSSGEARRLNEELKAAREQNEALQREIRERSLTPQRDNQVTEARFPNEDEYIKALVENGDKTEKEARWEYKNNQILWQNQQNLYKAMEAMNKRQQFESELRQKELYETSPDAKAAVEFFKGTPRLEDLPMADKIEAYKKLQPRITPQSSGRDLSSVKMAASGSQGNGASGAVVANNSQLDEAAKQAGFKSWKHQEDVRSCKTADQFDAIRKKYK